MNNSLRTRVLIIDSDIKGPYFFAENESTGRSLKSFINLLAQPHLESYDIRYISNVNIPDEGKLNSAFWALYANQENGLYQKGFKLLWEHGKKWVSNTYDMRPAALEHDIDDN